MFHPRLRGGTVNLSEVHILHLWEKKAQVLELRKEVLGVGRQNVYIFNLNSINLDKFRQLNIWNSHSIIILSHCRYCSVCKVKLWLCLKDAWTIELQRGFGFFTQILLCKQKVFAVFFSKFPLRYRTHSFQTSLHTTPDWVACCHIFSVWGFPKAVGGALYWKLWQIEQLLNRRGKGNAQALNK